jgi:hypothetical protein
MIRLAGWGNLVKNGIVAGLILLALIVLVSPAIVGRLAERSMDENLEWASAESDNMLITSQGFDRGWFSSEGQHRIDIQRGELYDFLLAFTNPVATDDLPALIIDTRLDHGLIPMTSMSRNRGSLKPGLGSAVSTLRIDYASGESLGLPGAIYSTMGITGELQSDYLLEPGTQDGDGVEIAWGQSELRVTSAPRAGSLIVRGQFDPLSFESADATFSLGRVAFAVDQDPGPFGFPLGSASVAIDSIRLVAADETLSVGPISLATEVSVRSGRVSGVTRLRIEDAPVELLGPANIAVDMRLKGADGAALGRLRHGLETAGSGYASGNAQLEIDVQNLLAAGLELDIERLDIELPSGHVTLKSTIEVAAMDAATFSWPGLLLALDATLDITLPADLVGFITEMNPDANMLIGLGYLRRSGDNYELRAGIQDGVVTINGAPMQIPLGALQ